MARKTKTPAADKPQGGEVAPAVRPREEIAAAVCQRIAAGESMTAAAVAEGTSHPTFCRWVIESAEIADEYARAREIRAEFRAQQIDDVAEKAERGELPPDVARVVIDARKWAASKLAPKRYGDKQTIAHEGEVGIKHSGLTPAERIAKLAELAKAHPELLAKLSN